mmetsp:Transcript_27019/g.49693  ORF Transcript_27019/g.49693 Transcript_27019/m.49693 type:complete len:1284 (-) Transcript_27019:98-3949(-)
MLATPAIVDTLPEVAKEGPQEEASTTEGEDVTASEDSDTDLKAMAEEDHEKQAQTALQYYAGRFGQNLDGEALECKEESATCTVEEKDSEAQLSRKPEEEVLAELDHDMTLKKTAQMVRRKPDGTSKRASAVAMDSTKRVSGRASPQPLMVPKNRALMPTFGYAAGLEEHPPFAKFDIRNSICSKVGGLLHGQVVRDRTGGELVVVGVKEVEGMPRLFFQPKSLKRPATGAFIENSAEALRQRVTPIKGAVEEIRELSPEELDAAEDSDGEEVFLCRHCRLPVGSLCYFANDKKTVPVHGECMAQMLLQEVKDEEAASKEEDAKLKKATREQYEIGWCASEVPNSAAAAQRLGCDTAGGMCCVVFDEAADSVRVVPTLEPAESVNLEYLSLSLQVRLREGREPIFSLDPVMSESGLTKSSMQAKVYSPDWLAGTSVGEVLFQADYHLKELSQGEYEQPVAGMRSCRELTEGGDFDKNWCAREWFVVRKADILLTESNVLVPRVRMGVEAREQEVGPNGIEDKALTRPSHPLVQYAEQFTNNFDLIAERKSVIYHLRDLAKATVMAKMLVEADVNMESAWLGLMDKPKEVFAMEVPMLWSERLTSQIRVEDGRIMPAEDGSDGRARQAVYGGVQFGLDKQSITVARSQVAGGQFGSALSAVSISTGRMPVALSAATVAGVPQAGMSAAPAAFGLLSAPQPGRRAPLSVFGLTKESSAAERMKQRMTAIKQSAYLRPGKRMPVLVPASAQIGGPAPPVFKQDVVAKVEVEEPEPRQIEKRGKKGARMMEFNEKEFGKHRPKKLTRMPKQPKVPKRGVDLNLDQFNLSQPLRVESSESCIAPDVKSTVLASAFWSSIESEGSPEFRDEDKKLLRAIFDPNLSDRRSEGEQFVPPDTSFEYVQRLRKLIVDEDACRQQRKDHFMSEDFTATSPGPLFPLSWVPSHKIAGKVQQMQGDLHARPDYLSHAEKFQNMLQTTVPTFDQSTEEGVRFRIYHIGNLEVRTVQEPAGLEDIGAVFSTSSPAAADERAPRQGRITSPGEQIVKVTEYIGRATDGRCSYIVLRTEKDVDIVTEKLRSGKVTWEENPADLEARNAFAKVVRSKEVCDDEITVRFVRSFIKKERDRSQSDASCSSCKRYAHGVYGRVATPDIIGKASFATGFAKQEEGRKWQICSLYANLESVEPQQSVIPKGPSTRRLTTGEHVLVKETGRSGVVAIDDGSQRPFKVVFQDGEQPKHNWYKEQELQAADGDLASSDSEPAATPEMQLARGFGAQEVRLPCSRGVAMR